MSTTRTATLTTAQELAVRRNAAKHLRGIPARQNDAAIDLLETKLLLEELHSRHTSEEWASWEAQEPSLGLL